VLTRVGTRTAKLPRSTSATKRLGRTNSENDETGTPVARALTSASVVGSPVPVVVVLATGMVHTELGQQQEVLPVPVPTPEEVRSPVGYALKQASLSHKHATRALQDGGAEVVFGDTSTGTPKRYVRTQL
jgi:hypothetical protein